MKKAGSTGNIFKNFNYDRIRPITSTHRNSRKKSSLVFLSNLSPINSFENANFLLNENNNNFDNSLLKKNEKQLYDELMFLKKRVNFLNAEISLAKSAKRKKDVQLNIKNKEIEGYLSDIQMSKDLSPINIDKLKETNKIIQLKNEFYTSKNTLNEIKTKTKELESQVKKAKPNILRQSNLILENRLKSLLSEYHILQDKNACILEELKEMECLSEIFAKNHKRIEYLKDKIKKQEINIDKLANDINEINNKQSKNEILLDRQKKKNITLNKKNTHLENELENKKQLEIMRINYKKKIEILTQKKNDLENNFKSNENAIFNIKKDIKNIEKIKLKDPLKLKRFNYSKIKNLEKNPDEICNSKILLLQSLIDESVNKKKRYQELIDLCIEKFNKIGYDYSELDKVLEQEDINDNNNNNENKDKNNNENNDNAKDNNGDNNKAKGKEKEKEKEKEDIKKDEENNNIKNKESEKENNNNNNGVDDNNKHINVENNKNTDKDKDKDTNVNINPVDNNKENNDVINDILKNKVNNDDNKEEIKGNETNEKKLNENNNIKSEEEKLKTSNKNTILEEEEKSDKIKEEKEKKNDNEENNSENDANNNGIISDEKQLLPIENKSNEIKNNNSFSQQKNEKNENNFTNEEFSEFTYILLINLESKKINEEIARQKIIMASTKGEIERNRFIEQMSFNLMKAMHCENKDSLDKVKKWVSTLLQMYGDDQKKMTDNFLTLFNNIKTYNSEQELVLSKKIKKYFLDKKDIVLKKLEPFKNKYISFYFLKQLIEEQNIELKDDYEQYLFYELKKFDDPNASLYDLKAQNLVNILENNQNDSKMDEESDIEITNEQYVNIITGFGIQLLKYLDTNKTDLRTVLGDLVQNISKSESQDGEKTEVVLIEPFINRMREIGIILSSDIEIYCLFSRYKLSDDYEIISVNLLEKELENFRRNNIGNYANINEANNGGMNNINNLNGVGNGVGIGSSDGNNLKVMEKVQEENEDNISNSDNK